MLDKEGTVIGEDTDTLNRSESQLAVIFLKFDMQWILLVMAQNQHTQNFSQNYLLISRLQPSAFFYIHCYAG
jgi:uncharacterized membrane protein